MTTNQRSKKPYVKPTVQSEQAPERQILQTSACAWQNNTRPVFPCTKPNA